MLNQRSHDPDYEALDDSDAAKARGRYLDDHQLTLLGKALEIFELTATDPEVRALAAELLSNAQEEVPLATYLDEDAVDRLLDRV